LAFEFSDELSMTRPETAFSSLSHDDDAATDNKTILPARRPKFHFCISSEMPRARICNFAT
jgi:hypothetical protein